MFFFALQGISFTLAAATVDPQSKSYNPAPLKEYLAALGVPYFYEEQGRRLRPALLNTKQ